MQGVRRKGDVECILAHAETGGAIRHRRGTRSKLRQLRAGDRGSVASSAHHDVATVGLTVADKSASSRGHGDMFWLSELDLVLRESTKFSSPNHRARRRLHASVPKEELPFSASPSMSM